MLASLLCAVLAGLLGTQDWQRAEREIKRLPPSAFPDLPPAVRHDLERRGCTIPQTVFAKGTENVIRGAFTRPGVIDWAVLCSIQRVSVILLFREGSIHNVDRLARHPDSTFLQIVDHDARENPIVGFSRAIARADAKHILAHHGDFGGPTPPPLDHDGIEDAFVEKGSSIFYWHQGRWLTLSGMD